MVALMDGKEAFHPEAFLDWSDMPEEDEEKAGLMKRIRQTMRRILRFFKRKFRQHKPESGGGEADGAGKCEKPKWHTIAFYQEMFKCSKGLSEDTLVSDDVNEVCISKDMQAAESTLETGASEIVTDKAKAENQQQKPPTPEERKWGMWVAKTNNTMPLQSMVVNCSLLYSF